MDIQRKYAERIATWREHPVAMVRELFGVEPDAWQIDALESFPTSPRLCMRACKGPGKSAVLAWLGWNFMLTRPFPVIGATSITGDNLRANLWTELARWHEKSPLLKAMFEITKTEIFAKEHPRIWKIEARTWPKDADSTQIGNALSGLHAKYVMWLLDESGDYPDAIMPTCEAIFAGAPVEAHIIQAGNPIRRGGPLWKACTTARHLWKVIEITGDPDDPKRSPRIGVEHAREQIEQWGRDNPWVLINIFGQFPPSDLTALIGPDEVQEAMRRQWKPYDIGQAPKILGVDVAAEGLDQSVIARRQGIQMLPFLKFRNIDSTYGSGVLVREWNEWGADAAFVDNTGGFGSGWVDQTRRLGKSPIPVHFSSKAHKSDRYFNKRSEMAFEFIQWIKEGGALPQDDRLLAALTSTTYEFKNDKLLLEPKEFVKEKIGHSPDEFDAAILTMAEPVSIAAKERALKRVNEIYLPFAELDRRDGPSYAEQGFDPYRER